MSEGKGIKAGDGDNHPYIFNKLFVCDISQTKFGYTWSCILQLMDSTSDSRSRISSVAHLSFTVKEQQNSTLFDTKRDGAGKTRGRSASQVHTNVLRCEMTRARLHTLTPGTSYYSVNSGTKELFIQIFACYRHRLAVHKWLTCNKPRLKVRRHTEWLKMCRLAGVELSRNYNKNCRCRH